MKFLAILFALIMAAVASPAPQLYENGFSPLLARYANAPEAPASTAHAAHVAAIAPITTYIAQAPYVAAYPALTYYPSEFGYRYAY